MHTCSSHPCGYLGIPTCWSACTAATTQHPQGCCQPAGCTTRYAYTPLHIHLCNYTVAYTPCAFCAHLHLLHQIHAHTARHKDETLVAAVAMLLHALLPKHGRNSALAHPTLTVWAVQVALPNMCLLATSRHPSACVAVAVLARACMLHHNNNALVWRVFGVWLTVSWCTPTNATQPVVITGGKGYTCAGKDIAQCKCCATSTCCCMDGAVPCCKAGADSMVCCMMVCVAAWVKAFTNLSSMHAAQVPPC